MRVAIHQPNLLPRLKVLQKIAAADLWVILDSVQYNDREWQNRARLVSLDAPPVERWLTVPVHRQHGRSTLIREVRIAVDDVDDLIRRSVRLAFQRSAHWPALDGILRQSGVFGDLSLTRLSVATTLALLELSGNRPAVMYSSALPVGGTASRLIAGLCEYVAADEYLSDSGARAYLKESDFGHTAVVWQQWQEPPDAWAGVTAWRDLSAINYIARAGAAAFRRHIAEAVFRPAPPLVTPFRGAQL